MKLYNTLSKKIEEFKPINPPKVSLYSCGPTVYDFAHIGHIRAYTQVDLLRRILTHLNYDVKHVMNITDVGHLSGDDDSGEEKMEKGAKKSGQTVWEVAKFYTDSFFRTMDSLNILRPNILCKATDHIQDMINLIKILQEKGFIYKTKEAVYFDTAKFKSYGKLSGQKLTEKKTGARSDVYLDPGKKHPTDFALWFKRVGRFANHTMYWNSPWGDGFPGWHIECSAMSMKYLGETIDIHAGGEDHIPVHHEDEIAQSEAVTGKTFVHFWFHYHFLNVDGKKMSKSLGNFYTLDDLLKRNINPMAMRYLFLQTHYRQLINFTWESAKAADETYQKLKDHVLQLKKHTDSSQLNKELSENFNKKFNLAIESDLQLPQALAITWQMLKSDLSSKEKLKLIFDFDKVFGLKLNELAEQKIPEEIIKLADERLKARQANDFKKADEIRINIESKGYKIKDIKDSYEISKLK